MSSTNDLAARACGSASNEGLVVLAEEQTAGRGRLRADVDRPAAVVDPDVGPALPAPELIAAGPVRRGRRLAHRAGGRRDRRGRRRLDRARGGTIKWPNDVRVDGRKIAGILVERPASQGLAASTAAATDGDRPGPPVEPGPAAVIGIGLNVNLDIHAFPAELLARATSIRIERGDNPADRSEVARDLIRRLDHWYQAVRSAGAPH